MSTPAIYPVIHSVFLNSTLLIHTYNIIILDCALSFFVILLGLCDDYRSRCVWGVAMLVWTFIMSVIECGVYLELANGHLDCLENGWERMGAGYQPVTSKQHQ